MDLEFLSEPVTSDDIESASGGGFVDEPAPDGEYTFVVMALKGKLSSVKQTPMFKVSLAHTGDFRKYGRVALTLFNTIVGKKQLTQLALACGMSKDEAFGLKWGWTGEADQYGRFDGYIVDQHGDCVSERFLGKEINAVLRTKNLPDGTPVNEVHYIKVPS